MIVLKTLKQIVDILNDDSLNAVEIAIAAGRDVSAIRKALHHMVAEGLARVSFYTAKNGRTAKRYELNRDDRGHIWTAQTRAVYDALKAEPEPAKIATIAAAAGVSEYKTAEILNFLIAADVVDYKPQKKAKGWPAKLFFVCDDDEVE